NAVPVTEEARAEEGMPHGDVAGIVGGSRTKRAAVRRRPRPAPVMPYATARSCAETEQAWDHIPKGSEIIHDKPWPFLSAAVGIGVLTGWLFKGEWLGRRKAGM